MWVWAESGGDAFPESAQRQPALNPFKPYATICEGATANMALTV